MLEALVSGLPDLLARRLPATFGGTPPLIDVTVTELQLEVERPAHDVVAGQPQAEEVVDVLDFPGASEYQLTRTPYPGRRRVQLLGDAGPLSPPVSDAEVVWDSADPRQFTLNLGSGREPAQIRSVQVSYPVIAVLARLDVQAALDLVLAGSDRAALDRAPSLVLAVAALNRAELLALAASTTSDGVFSSSSIPTDLQLLGATRIDDGSLAMHLQIPLALVVRRDRQTDEGVPIASIVSPGETASGTRPVVVDVGLT